MKLNFKRVVSVLSVALLSVTTVSAQQFIEVLPEVGSINVVAQGDYFQIMEERLPDPAPGFRAYNIWAAVVGEDVGPPLKVNALEEFNISGVHQVYDIDRRGDPLETAYDDFAGFADNLRAFDSFVLWNSNQQSAGSSPTETNDGSNPGQLRESMIDPEAGYADGDLTIGIGQLGVSSRGQGPPLFLGLTGDDAQRPLAHIVLWDGDTSAADGHYAHAMLEGGLGGEADGDAEGETESFSGVVLGAGTLVEIPEPAMGVLAMLSVAGLFGLRRRNG